MPLRVVTLKSLKSAGRRLRGNCTCLYDARGLRGAPLRGPVLLVLPCFEGSHLYGLTFRGALRAVAALLGRCGNGPNAGVGGGGGRGRGGFLGFLGGAGGVLGGLFGGRAGVDMSTRLSRSEMWIAHTVAEWSCPLCHSYRVNFFVR